ncbi:MULTISPECIES: hypothetical protein [Lysinibacillus]|nr:MULTISPECIES: hypothetical protein [Lysinibacillus]
MKKSIKLIISAICLTAFLVGPSVVDVSAASSNCIKPCKDRP